MTEDDVAQAWLQRGREALEAAAALAETRHFADAVNRIYYACFYAVTALLLSEGHSSRKHSGALALFDLHWVRPGRVPPQMGRFYHQSFERRLDGDYTIATAFSREEVESWLTQARDFVQTIADLLPPV